MTEATTSALERVPHRIIDPERIPTGRYHDPAFFELEREKLWPHVWQMACRLEEIPEPGDYTVYTILDRSVLLLHTGQGVKAFRNACRHRGVRLAHGPGHCGQNGITCPFHGWRWNSEGENIFVYGPQLFSEALLDRAEIDLAPVRVEFWAGCAFINFDPEAPSLREFLGPVADRMDARHADKLKMDWWFGTVLPTNWKLAMEAFHEGYHSMQTHPQIHRVAPNATRTYALGADGLPVNENLDGPQTLDMYIDFMAVVSKGMGGLVHHTEVAVLEGLRDMAVPADAAAAEAMFFDRAYRDVTEDARQRGAAIFDLHQVARDQEFHGVEFMFPHFFLLPLLGAMASYRIRPLTAETCLFELWSLVIRPDGEPYDTPTEPTMLAYNSADFPEIPRQDYANLPLQQLGLHDIEHMRLSRTVEGTISNYQRLIDGYLAGLDRELLTRAGHIVNSGSDAPIRDIGF